VAGSSWGTVTTSSNSVTTGLGPRFYLANSCATAFSKTVFQKINLLGATISFTADLSNVGCGEDAAFYFVGMPASSIGGNGDYYCDANCVGGSCCTEMDVMEANRHSLQITPHMCTAATSGCDANGCALNTKTIPNGFGPSTSFTINTLNPFTLSITFQSSGGQLSSIVSVISQGTKSITLTHNSALCGSNYLPGMTTGLTGGMVAVWSFWSGSMGWLDSSACSSDTSEIANPKFIFSNLVITGAGSVVVPPTAPIAPASQQCIICSSCTINGYWVEFTVPSSITVSTATVQCSSGSFPCTWDASGSKYQCSCSTGCTNPSPVINGKACPFPASALSEESTQSSGTLDTATIAIIAVGCVVGVILLVAVIVVVVIKKNKTEEYV